MVGEGDGDVAAGVPAVRACDRADGGPAGGAVPAVAAWRMASLPRGLKAAEIERLLAGCDRDTAAGRRDYAVLSLLARLGLRGAEAAGLQLGDIDWRAGEIAVTGKGNRIERLPLPAQAGEALAAWLERRAGRSASRGPCSAPSGGPIRPLTPEAVRADHGQGLRAGRAGPAGRPPVPPRAGDRDAAGRGVAA